MARPSKPTILKELSGNPGKRKLNKREPKASGKAVAANALPDGAKRVFRRIVGAMPNGVITAADEALVSSLAWAIWQRDLAILEMAEADTLVAGSTGQQVLNPLLAHINKQSELIRALGSRLGLDPVARQGLQTPDAPDDDGGFNIH